MKEGDTTYIMKKYFLCLYLKGDQTTEYSKEELAEIQKGHLANINKYAALGKIKVRAPPLVGSKRKCLKIRNPVLRQDSLRLKT